MKRVKHAQKKAMGVFSSRPSRTGSGIASRQSTEGMGGVGGGSSVAGVFGNSFGNQDPPLDPHVNRSALSGSRALSNHILWRSAFRGNVSFQIFSFFCDKIINFPVSRKSHATSKSW